jgi:hypothetical protein
MMMNEMVIWFTTDIGSPPPELSASAAPPKKGSSTKMKATRATPRPVRMMDEATEAA